MANVKKSVIINAPVEQVFSYVADPTNIPEFWPGLVEVRDVEPLPNGGHKYRYQYKMAGVRFDGTTEVTEYVTNQRIVYDNKGGVSSIIKWTYEPEDGGTKVTVDAIYSVNIPVLRKLAESFLTRVNENEAATLLANLKARMEAQ